MIPRHCGRCCCRSWPNATAPRRSSTASPPNGMRWRNATSGCSTCCLQKLRRMQFGPRSERLPEDQLQFAFEEVEASLADNEAATEKRSPAQGQKNTARARARRGRPPAHPPCLEQRLLPERPACPCCWGGLRE